jgi:hypothetical protein
VAAPTDPLAVVIFVPPHIILLTGNMIDCNGHFVCDCFYEAVGLVFTALKTVSFTIVRVNVTKV